MQLFHKKYGESGSPLIIMHGLFGMLDNWHNLAKKFAEDHVVYLVDLRNHGQSQHSSMMDYEVMAEDINELLSDLGLESANIMGHSMGGKVAMQFALTYPGKTEKLVVVDIAPVKYKPGHDTIFEALFAADLHAETRGAIDKAMEEKIPEMPVRQFLLKSLARNSNNAFEWKFNLQGIYDNYEKIIDDIPAKGTYKGPVLFIGGAGSDYIRESYHAGIKKLFPLAEISMVEGSGHWVNAEKPEELLALVSAFLDK